MKDKEYFTHLYEIASLLNKEFSLPSALRKSLEKTVEILEIETGWIWLSEADHKSVYLAASHNLPPALSKHPERLSGWCYCIKQYLSDEMDQAMNISEITCSRLQDVSIGTKGLKFHAVIPIIVNEQKVGLMNLLSKESRQLCEKELTILNTISELIGTAIQRTRLKQSQIGENIGLDKNFRKILERVLHPQIEGIISCLDNENSSEDKIKDARKKAIALRQQLSMLSEEVKENDEIVQRTNDFAYPESPLTKRELEVLALIKTGSTNGQISKQLYIAERTVKFHVTSILSKLNADNRTEAVDISMKRGLLSM